MIIETLNLKNRKKVFDLCMKELDKILKEMGDINSLVSKSWLKYLFKQKRFNILDKRADYYLSISNRAIKELGNFYNITI